MRGRDKFKKYYGLLRILTAIFGLFPRKIREALFIHNRGRKGVVGLAIRYALLKTIALSVGENVSIHPDVYIFKAHNLSIGNNVSIHPMCYIDATGGIEIGNDVSIAHDVSIISFNHRYDDFVTPIKDQEVEKKKIKIKDNIWIGAKAVVLQGVTVNCGSIIGAASVVTHDVDENNVVVGSPAKTIKIRESR